MSHNVLPAKQTHGVMAGVGVKSTAMEKLGVSQLKPRQDEIVRYLMKKEDVFAILPTGFGKSLPYQLFPLLKKQKHPEEKPIVLIVTPLLALMKDQVQKLTSSGLGAATISEVDLETSKFEELMYLFDSPENYLQTPGVLEFIGTDLRGRVTLLVVDEVHTIPKWGEVTEGRRKWQPKKKEAAFRKFFSQVGEIRSFLSEVPVLALTATATVKTRTQVIESLSLAGCHMVEELPDRPNLRYAVIRISTDIAGAFFGWWIW